jgi:hypothetical protein
LVLCRFFHVNCRFFDISEITWTGGYLILICSKRLKTSCSLIMEKEEKEKEARTSCNWKIKLPHNIAIYTIYTLTLTQFASFWKPKLSFYPNIYIYIYIYSWRIYIYLYLIMVILNSNKTYPTLLLGKT